MIDRASTRPLLVNSDPAWRDDDSEYDHVSEEEPEWHRSLTADSSSTNTSSSSVHASIRPTKRPRSDSGMHIAFAELKGDQLHQDKDMRMIELKPQERQVTLQEQDALARASVLSQQKEEAAARVSKLRQEAEACRQDRKVHYCASERSYYTKGCHERIDLRLPLSTRF